MPTCPVCNTEYFESQNKKCPKCKWYVIPDIRIQNRYLDTITVLRYQQEVTEWAKKIYQQKNKLEKKTQPSPSIPYLDNKLELILGKLEQLIHQQNRQQAQISDIQKQLPVLNNSQEPTTETVSLANDDFNDNFPEDILEATNNDFIFDDRDLESEIDNQQAALYQKYRNANTLEEAVRIQQQQLNESDLNDDLVSLTRDNQNREQSQDPDLDSLAENYPQNLQQQEEQRLIDIYNSKQDISPWSIQVSELETSIEARRVGDNNNKATFQKNRRQGDYWIIELEQGKYLVPNLNIKLNQPNIKALKFLFRCEEQEPIDSLQLIKPGKVSKKGEHWELEELGIIKFISHTEGGSDEEE